MAVIGDPIGHSRSPLMHAAALEVLGMHDVDYRAIHVRASDLRAFVARDAVTAGLTGFNVTVPHKSSIMPMLHHVDPGAAQIGAVNTVYAMDDGWGGCNTDVIGFGDALDALVGCPSEAVSGPPVVVLGAGGAARAVIAALCGRRWATSVVWVTRDAGRLRDSGWPHPEAPHRVRVVEWSAWDRRCAGAVVVQATPVGLAGTTGALPVAFEELELGSLRAVFDLVVPAGPHSLYAAACAAGVRACDGREMLVGQGVSALERWLGADRIAPHQTAVREAMRQALRCDLGAG